MWYNLPARNQLWASEFTIVKPFEKKIFKKSFYFSIDKFSFFCIIISVRYGG